MEDLPCQLAPGLVDAATAFQLHRRHERARGELEIELHQRQRAAQVEVQAAARRRGADRLRARGEQQLDDGRIERRVALRERARHEQRERDPLAAGVDDAQVLEVVLLAVAVCADRQRELHEGRGLADLDGRTPAKQGLLGAGRRGDPLGRAQRQAQREPLTASHGDPPSRARARRSR